MTRRIQRPGSAADRPPLQRPSPDDSPRLLTTGGAGFIGSALVRHLLSQTEATVINVDKLTYAGHLESLDPVLPSPRHTLEQVNITDAAEIDRIFAEHQPDAVLHLAAESHVDRSIDGAAPFIETNVVGTYTLLDAALRYWRGLSGERRERFRFLHVSTDEVYGSLGSDGLFRESTPYDPRSPYSASKAAADHLARAWHHTYGLPVIVTNSSNNYGPYQYPEKLIPTVILRAASREPIPIYGAGDNVRDWLHVEDHVRALLRVLARGRAGETYNIGAANERTNMEVARAICGILDDTLGTDGQPPRTSLIQSVEDRPGHDFRYAIDAAKIERELEWTPQESFESGLRQTVAWYLSNGDWCEAVTGGKSRLERQGLAGAEGS